MLTCMSWRRSSGETKRVVAQAPSVPTMPTGSTADSWVTKVVGASRPGTGSNTLRTQWKRRGVAPSLRRLQAVPGAR